MAEPVLAAAVAGAPAAAAAAHPRLLAAVGAADDPATFSGTPHHCLAAGRAAGVFDRGLSLPAGGPRWRRRRVAWNLARLVRGRGRGGYQYAAAFLDALWRQDAPAPGDTVVSMFQLVPEAVLARPGATVFYVDQTLAQLFEGYGLDGVVPAAVRADAIARERAQYRRARLVIGHSRWAARDVTARYGVAAHAVVCGANLSAAALAQFEARARPPERRTGVRLVFVGKDWERKGLDRLVRAVRLARAGGAAATLTVIGVDPAALPAALAAGEGVAYAGFVDKRREAARFVDLVAGHDVGCLLSRAEAGGIALREFCRLGLATLAPNVGGAPEYVVPAAAELVDPDAPDGAVAAAIARLATDADELLARRRAAWAARAAADWNRAVARLGALLDGAGA